MFEPIECKLLSNNGITQVNFNPFNDELLSISTWNKTLEIYNSNTGENITSYSFDSPQLCNIWVDINMCASGGADGIISINSVKLGSHNSSISSLNYISNSKTLISSSFNGLLKIWNIKTKKLINELKLDYKIYSIHLLPNNNILLNCSERILYSFNLENLNEFIISKSPLQYNTSCLATNKNSIAIGSFEGRIAIEYIEEKKRNYAFKAHYEIKEENRYIYPVTCLLFNPKNDYLATSGSDGKVLIWNLEQKRKVSEFGPFHTSISSISFSSNGDKLAISISYGFEKGEIGLINDQLLIVKII